MASESVKKRGRQLAGALWRALLALILLLTSVSHTHLTLPTI